MREAETLGERRKRHVEQYKRHKARTTIGGPAAKTPPKQPKKLDLSKYHGQV